MFIPYPLQCLPWGLPDPAPVVTTGDGVTRDSVGEEEGLRGLHQSWALLLQLHLGQDTWDRENTVSPGLRCRVVIYSGLSPESLTSGS